MRLAPAHLTVRGLLVLEHGHDQRPAVVELAAANGFVLKAVYDDLAGLPRAAVFCRSGFSRD
jgi:release factor glutamine methyltransferase